MTDDKGTGEVKFRAYKIMRKTMGALQPVSG